MRSRTETVTTSDETVSRISNDQNSGQVVSPARKTKGATRWHALFLAGDMNRVLATLDCTGVVKVMTPIPGLVAPFLTWSRNASVEYVDLTPLQRKCACSRVGKGPCRSLLSDAWARSPMNIWSAAPHPPTSAHEVPHEPISVRGRDFSAA